MPKLICNGVALHYTVRGDGPLIVLVAGAGMRAAAWESSIARSLVDAGYRTVTFDNRGMPPSDVPPPPYSIEEMADDTVALIEGLGGPAQCVIGYSMGALIAQTLAIRRPELLNMLVLIATHARRGAVLKAQHAEGLPRLRRGEDLPPGIGSLLGALQLFSPGTLADDDRAAACLAQHGQHSDLRGRLGQGEASAGYDDRLNELKAITHPCLVVAFEHDVLTPPARGREIAETVANGEFVEIPRAGHAGILEAPGQATDAILRFLARVKR